MSRTSRTSTSTSTCRGTEAAGLGRSAEDEALERFTDTDVKEAIESLPESFRMAVLLADVEGFSYKEIAEITDVPIGTVMSRIHREEKRCRRRCSIVGVHGASSGHPTRPGRETRAVGDSEAAGQPGGTDRGADGARAGFVGCDETIERLYTISTGS